MSLVTPSNVSGVSRTTAPVIKTTPDEFEPDNTPETATTMTYNGPSGHHNFHVAGDEDWIKFVTGPDDLTYVDTFTLEANSDPAFEIFRLENDGVTLTPIASSDVPGDEVISGHFLFEATYYLRVTNTSGIYGDNTGYDIIVSGFEDGILPGGVAGVVSSAASPHQAINGATITVSCLGSLTTDSDGSGTYAFPSLPVQQYTATATAPHFLPQTQTVMVDASTISSLDFQLTPAPRAKLGVSPSNRDVGSGSGSTTFDVSNTGDAALLWTASVTAGGDWASISSGASGTDAGTITVACTKNPANAQRVATIHIDDPDAANSPIDVTVTQAANTTPVLSVGPLSRNVSADAGSTGFNVSNAGFGTLHWSAQVVNGGAWLAILSGASGVNGGSIALTYPANPSSSARTGTVRVTDTSVKGGFTEVTVVQAGLTIPSDVNDDLSVNAVDVQLVINQALGESTGFDGDVNHDTSVNAVDVQLVINAALGL